MKTAGTIKVNGIEKEVTSALSCGPGETPRTFNFCGGSVEKLSSGWIFSPNWGYAHRVEVDTSGYTGKFI